MIKAIIFDVDGVLLDNRKEVIEAFQKTGRDLGKPISVSELRKTFGLTWDDMLVKLFGKSDENTRRIFSKNWKEYEPRMKIMKYSEYVLKRLKVRRAIMSSKPLENLNRQLGSLTIYFEVIISKEDTQKHKPDPEPLMLTCKKLGVNPEEAIYVGDTIIDYETAKSAGTGFIGFISGSATEKEFEDKNAKHIASLKDLLSEF